MRKKLIIALCALAVSLCAAAVYVAADDSPTLISTKEELLALSGKSLSGSYLLTEDIDLTGTDFGGISKLVGTFDGGGHTITLAMSKSGACGFVINLGDPSLGASGYGNVSNLEIAGSIYGGGRTGAIASTGYGKIENCTVSAAVSCGAVNCFSAFANCNGKYALTLINCTFSGSVTDVGVNYTQFNYKYFGIFLGYNGGAFGGGEIDECKVEYKLTLPTSDLSRIEKTEYFNCSGKTADCVVETSGGVSVLTYTVSLTMHGITAGSLNDEGIMANYGSPVVRLTVKDGDGESTYRYLDGFDKGGSRFMTDFGENTLDGMYAYKDISYLVTRVTKSETELIATSEYSVVTIGTAAEFESFARLINSAVPLKFKLANGSDKNYSILDSLTVGIELSADIDLRGTDKHGNESEFCGIGKQEFFPYRAGIDGKGHTLSVDIDKPDGYMVGVISITSEMTSAIEIKDLTVEGSIVGRFKTGLVGYHDLVCNNYVNGGDLVFTNVVCRLDVGGSVGVGGLLGALAVTDERVGVYFNDCTYEGTITLNDVGGKGGMYGGGFIGVAGLFNQNANVNISGGSSSAKLVLGAKSSVAGGIAGYLSGDLNEMGGVVCSGVTSEGGSYSGEAAGKVGSVKITAANTFENSLPTVAVFNVQKTNEDSYSVSFKGTPVVEDGVTKYLKSYTTAYSGKNVVYAVTNEECAFYATYIDFYNAEGTVICSTANGGTTPKEVGNYRAKLFVYEDDSYLVPGKLSGAKAVDEADIIITQTALDLEIGDLNVPYNRGDENGLKSLALPELPDGAHWLTTYKDKNGAVYTEGVTEKGTYTITYRLIVSDKALFLSRYSVDAEIFDEKTADFNVTNALLTVTAKDVTVTYGDAEPTPQYTVSGLNEGESVDLNNYLSYSYIKWTAPKSYSDLNAGEVRIVWSETTACPDYDLEFVEGKLTILKADIPADILSQITIDVGINSIALSCGYEGFSYSLSTSGGYVASGTALTGLTGGTVYRVYYKFDESANYNALSTQFTVVTTERGIYGMSYTLFYILIAVGVLIVIGVVVSQIVKFKNYGRKE